MSLNLSGSKKNILSERVLGDVLMSVDFLLICGSAVIAKWLYIGDYLNSPQEVEPYLVIGLLAGFVAVAVFRAQNLYCVEVLTNCFQTFRRIVYGVAVALVALLSIGYFLKISADFSRGWLIIWISFAIIFMNLNHVLAMLVVRRLVSAGVFTRNFVIYGGGDIASKMIGHLHEQNSNMRLIGVFDDGPRHDCVHVALDGGLSDLIDLGRLERIDEVLLAIPLTDERRLASVVRRLSALPVDIRVCPDLGAFRMRPLGIVHYDGVPVLELVRRPLDNWAPIIKGLEDRVLASLILIMCLPVMLLVAIAIKLDSKGPIFFHQRRHGYNHEIITVLKFRTMHVAQDGKEVRQAARNDPRVTSLGGWLRRASIDELPQLFNVVTGKMSLVGPRPHALAHNEYYSALFETYASRHRMRPGITGWAQINGFRGETDTPDKMRKRVEYDLYYIENWSVWFDIKILLLTPFFGLFHKNAF